MEAEDPNGGKLFPGTRWSLVAQSREPEAANRALSELCNIYWFPVYAYIRSLDQRHHDAQDLAQAFFASLLDREDFAKADPQRGRLRTFLCVAVKRFVISAYREKNRLKRGGGVFLVSIDVDEADEQYNIEPREEETPETYFRPALGDHRHRDGDRHLEGRVRQQGPPEAVCGTASLPEFPLRR